MHAATKGETFPELKISVAPQCENETIETLGLWEKSELIVTLTHLAIFLLLQNVRHESIFSLQRKVQGTIPCREITSFICWRPKKLLCLIDYDASPRKAQRKSYYFVSK